MSDCLVLESYRNGQTQMHYNCVCHSLTPFPFVVVTLKSHCDKCMTPAWIMDDPTGQALGPKAVRGYGPLCVTALTPYKFTSSQNWHSVVLSNPQLTLKSSWYVTAWMCATLRVLIFSFYDMHVHYKGTTTSTCCSILEAVVLTEKKSFTWLHFVLDCLHCQVLLVYYPHFSSFKLLKIGLTVINCSFSALLIMHRYSSLLLNDRISLLLPLVGA